MVHYHFIKSLIDTLYVVFFVYLTLGILALFGIMILPVFMFTPVGIFISFAFLYGNMVAFWRL